MRGRLIYRFKARLHIHDTQTQANADVAPGVPGFDSDFREPATVDLDGDGVAERIRPELPAVLVDCQVEPDKLDILNMRPSGNDPQSMVELVFHFRDLEAAGLVDTVDGIARLRPGTRLSELLTTSLESIQLMAPPTGLFAVEARPIGWGLGLRGSRRNLLLVRFGSRSEGIGLTGQTG